MPSSTFFLSAMLMATVVAGGVSHARAQTTDPAAGNAMIQQGQIQNLENRLQREIYQQQQQQYRAQDRQIAPLPQPVVPRVRQTCQLLPSGSGFVSTCR